MSLSISLGYPHAHKQVFMCICTCGACRHSETCTHTYTTYAHTPCVCVHFFVCGAGSCMVRGQPFCLVSLPLHKPGELVHELLETLLPLCLISQCGTLGLQMLALLHLDFTRFWGTPHLGHQACAASTFTHGTISPASCVYILK